MNVLLWYRVAVLFVSTKKGPVSDSLFSFVWSEKQLAFHCGVVEPRILCTMQEMRMTPT
jgi:hypothetical protein